MSARVRHLRWRAWSWGRRQPVYVLVAEEDSSIRRRIATELRRHGYNVVEASDGPDLVELLRAWYYPGTHAAPVDVIIASVALFPATQGANAEHAFPDEATATPILWLGRPDANGHGPDVDSGGLLTAVDRLVGRLH